MTVRAVHYHMYSLTFRVMNDYRIFWPHLSMFSAIHASCHGGGYIVLQCMPGNSILYLPRQHGNQWKCRMASLCLHRETADNHDEHKRSRVHTVGKQMVANVSLRIFLKSRISHVCLGDNPAKPVKMKKTLQVTYLYVQRFAPNAPYMFFCAVDGAVAVKICAMA